LINVTSNKWLQLIFLNFPPKFDFDVSILPSVATFYVATQQHHVRQQGRHESWTALQSRRLPCPDDSMGSRFRHGRIYFWSVTYLYRKFS
jgi:hypothetical protein